MKQRLAIIGMLLGLVFCAHAPAFCAGFVWDDTALVLRDPLIRSWRLIPEGLQHFLFTDATASNFYRPLQRLTYTIEYILFGFHPAPYHCDNICLHAAAVIALFAFALAFLQFYDFEEEKALTLAAIAAATWGLHPLHSAVVDYVAGRADSLAAIFGFSGLYFAIRAFALPQRIALKFHALAGLALLASALSKESGLIFGAIWIALLAFRKGWAAIVCAVVVLAFVFTIYLTLRSQADVLEVPRFTPPAPALVRPIIAARALAEYSGLLVAPIKLHMDREVESRPWGLSNASLSAAAWRELETVIGVAVIGALLLCLIRARRRQPAVFALLLFAIISYLPVSGMFALNATIAEHWIYVPSAFVLLAAVVQLGRSIAGGRARYLAIAGMVCVLALLGTRTFFRARDWSDERTFFERTIAAGGDSARMLINLGSLEMNAGHFAKAGTVLQQALAKEPEHPFALLNLAALALKQNDFATARSLLARAQKIRVTEGPAYEMMAVLQFKESGKIDLLRLRLASRTGPAAWSIRRRYIEALDQSGYTGAAVAELRAVLAVEWYRAESWQLLSRYLDRLGRVSEAAEALTQAQRSDVHLSQY